MLRPVLRDLKHLKTRWLILFAVLVFVLDYAQIYMTFRNYGSMYNGIMGMHAVLGGWAEAPTQYRVLVPGLYGAILGFFPSFSGTQQAVWIYEPLKMLLMFWAICAFFVFVREFLEENWALLGTLILCACLPLTFRYDYAGQYAELAIFAMGFRAIWRNDQKNTIKWIILGTLNRETAFILPFLNFLLNRKKTNLWLWSFFAYSAVFFGIRLFLGWRDYVQFLTVGTNILRISNIYKFPQGLGKTIIYSPYFNPVWFIIPMVGIWLYWSLKDFKKKPDFFQKAFWLIPLFYMISFFFALQDEIRIFIWFYLILIPMSLWSWREDSFKDTKPPEGDEIFTPQHLSSKKDEEPILSLIK
jgi:hypothetical protein